MESKLSKKDMFRIMAKSPRDNIIALAEIVTNKHTVVTVKKPTKTLVMVKMKEPVAEAEFFLGEILSCEAFVKIGDVQGMAVTAGDDFDKVFSMAVIDASCNAGVEETSIIYEQLSELALEINRRERQEFSRHNKSSVDFNMVAGT